MVCIQQGLRLQFPVSTYFYSFLQDPELIDFSGLVEPAAAVCCRDASVGAVLARRGLDVRELPGHQLAAGHSGARRHHPPPRQQAGRCLSCSRWGPPALYWCTTITQQLQAAGYSLSASGTSNRSMYCMHRHLSIASTGCNLRFLLMGMVSWELGALRVVGLQAVKHRASHRQRLPRSAAGPCLTAWLPRLRPPVAGVRSSILLPWHWLVHS